MPHRISGETPEPQPSFDVLQASGGGFLLELILMRRLCLVALLVATIAIGADAHGQGIVITPNSPVVGSTFTATVLNLPMPAMSASWYSRVTVPGGCSSAMFNQPGTTTNTTVTPQIPGVWGIGGRFIEPIGSTVTVTTTIAISPPDRVQLISGTGVSTVPWTLTLIKSQLKAANNPIGASIAGLVQERLTNRHYWDGNTDQDTDWGPSTPSSQFYLQGSQLFDWVMFGDARWSSIPIGTILMTYHQDLRIVFSMMCQDGTTYTFNCPLGGWDFTFTKDTANSYSVSIR
jgi:hypothetical protein